MHIDFIGAAQTVTGSKHLIRTKHANVLLDCGMFQGRRRESVERNKNLGFDPAALDAVVLSHAHIDHSGTLPLLVKQGYQGPIYTTPATRDLCAVMLEDSAVIQAADARYINKAIDRDHADMEHVEPLYSVDDVVRTLQQVIAVPYHRWMTIARGVKIMFHDAGHVLGSAVTALDIDDDTKKRIVYTGDLGRKNMPILRDPEVVDGADMLIIESTYGDRLHGPIDAVDDALAAVLARTYQRGGKVIIPSFALERAQEVLYAIRGLRKQGRMPPMPVYVDSPLTVKITDIFKLHPECYDAEMRALLQGKDTPFEFEGLHYISDTEDSKALDASKEASVIISASGGRQEHHLHRRLPGAAHARPAHRGTPPARANVRRRARPPRRGGDVQRLLRTRRSAGPRRLHRSRVLAGPAQAGHLGAWRADGSEGADREARRAGAAQCARPGTRHLDRVLTGKRRPTRFDLVRCARVS